MSSNRIRVFVDTNVDASLLLLETSKTTIAELKRHVEERIRTNYNEMVDAPKGFSDNTLERINCLFDAASPSRERENCFTVPDEYTIGSISSDQNVVRVFAEYSIPVVRQKQSAFVTPARSSKKRAGEKTATQTPATQKKQRMPEAGVTQSPAKGNEDKKEGITRVPSSNTLKNQKKREKRKRKRESARLVVAETKERASPEPMGKEPLLSPDSEAKPSIVPQKPSNDGSGTSKMVAETKKKKKKDKNAPKRGMSAFMFYSNEMRDKVKAENPGIAFGDVAKRISAMWKDLSDSEKVKYNDMAEKDKQRYATAMETYNAEVQKDVVASPKAQEEKNEPESKKTKGSAVSSDKSDSPSSSSGPDSSDSSSSDEDGDLQAKESSKPPVKAKDATGSSDSSSSDSSGSSSDDSDSSSSSSDSDTSDEEPLKAQPSGKFDGADGGVLSQLLQSATKDDEKSKKINVEELKKKAVKDKEAKEQQKRENAVPESFQWQKSHKNFNADSLVKLCRTMVRTIVNHEREAKGLKAVPVSKLYKDQENRPDWWPLGEFTSGSFEKKGDATTVYNAARKVLSAIYDVPLDES